jgi:hypothetical protein
MLQDYWVFAFAENPRLKMPILLDTYTTLG